MKSNRFELIPQDIKSWAVTAVLFTIPVIGIYVTFVQSNFQDGFAWSDFIPNLFVQGSMVAYVLNESWALLLKWYQEHQYHK